MPASSRFGSKPPAQMVSELLDALGGPASGSAPGVTRFRAIGHHEPFPLWVWQPTITFYCGGQKERMTRQALPVELRSADDVTRQPVTESVASGRTEPSKSRSKWSAVIPASTPASSRTWSTFVACPPKKHDAIQWLEVPRPPAPHSDSTGAKGYPASPRRSWSMSTADRDRCRPAGDRSTDGGVGDTPCEMSF